MNREPLVTVASITSGVAVVVALLAAFGLPLSDEQTAAVLAVAAFAAPLVVAALARSRVTPVASGGARRKPADVGPEAGETNLVHLLIVAILLLVFIWVVVSVLGQA